MSNILHGIGTAIASIFVGIASLFHSTPPPQPEPPKVEIQATTTVELVATTTPEAPKDTPKPPQNTPKSTPTQVYISPVQPVVVEESKKVENPIPSGPTPEEIAEQKEQERLDELEAEYYKDKAALERQINQIKLQALKDMRATEGNGVPLAIVVKQQEEIRLVADRKIFELENQLEELRLDYNESLYK